MLSKIQSYLWMGMAGWLLASCAFDNYEAPAARLEGRIVYQGEPIPVSYNDVTFQLWEPGWQTRTAINVIVAQDGSYSAQLFNGSYQLVFPGNQGPFMILPDDATGSDTILVDMQGNQTLDIEVMPFYMVRNPQFSASARTVTAGCQLEQIITGDNAREVEQVSLYISETNFVDTRTSISTANIGGADITDLNNISLSTEVPAVTPAQNYVYARIGVKISGIEDMIFSPVERVEL